MGKKRIESHVESHVESRRNLLVIYLLLAGLLSFVVFMFVTGKAMMFFKFQVVPLILIVAILTGKTKRFLKDWSIFIGLTMLFDSLRGLIYIVVSYFKLPVYYKMVVHFDLALFGGQLASNRFQQWFYAKNTARWIDRLSAIAYGSHFLFFLIFGFIVWNFKREYFWQYKYAFVFVMYLGLCGYLLFPTVPPWMIGPHLDIPKLYNVLHGLYKTYIPHLYPTFATNPIAAMPSLHAAFAFLCVLIAAHHWRWKGFLITFLYFLVLCFSTLYTPSHYVLDLIAGMFCAWLGYYLFYWSRFSKFFANFNKGMEKLSFWYVLAIAFFLVCLTQVISLWSKLFVVSH